MGGIGGGASQFGGGAPKTSGGFSFGQASQFGGAGSLFGGASAAAGAGAGAGAGADDPYNIPIDLTKIKRTEKPAKTFEEKTQEEKLSAMQALAKSGTTGGAKSIMKKPGQPKKGASLAFGQCIMYEYDKDPESSAVAQRVDSKDISDMRDEKSKLRDMLQEKENEQLAQIKKMQALMNAKTGDKVDDSVGESGNLSQGKAKQITESYDTDTFEDQSIS